MSTCVTCGQPIARQGRGWAHAITSVANLDTSHAAAAPCDDCGSAAEPRMIEGAWLCGRCGDVGGAGEGAAA